MLDLVDTIVRQIGVVTCGHPLDQGGQCLYIAHAVATVLHSHGLRPLIQAGSLQWPIVRREDDDGQRVTHFAYMWEPDNPASIAARAAGALPEMHVWLGLLTPRPTLIDFGTSRLRRHAEAFGLTWRSSDPPDYLWATEDEMPDWVVYAVNRDATLLACALLKRIFDPSYLKEQVSCRAKFTSKTSPSPSCPSLC